jgi:hypothetical protein
MPLLTLASEGGAEEGHRLRPAVSFRSEGGWRQEAGALQRPQTATGERTAADLAVDGREAQRGSGGQGGGSRRAGA